MNANGCREWLQSAAFQNTLCELYGTAAAERQKVRYNAIFERFCAQFGERENLAFLTAPGRTELGGNHTDHQHGCVLGGAVDLDFVGVVAPRNDNRICIFSEGYSPVLLTTEDNSAKIGEEQHTALSRGVLHAFSKRGVSLCGFDLYLQSDVPVGGGVSSSAAFELLLCTAINHTLGKRALPRCELARIGNEAEQTHLNKKSGLLDQTVSSLGGLVFLDFANEGDPYVENLSFSFEDAKLALFVVDTGSSHAALGDDYAAIRDEMHAISSHFGKEVLSEVNEETFFASLPELFRTESHRSILRAMHFFEENKRAKEEAEALKNGDVEAFLNLVRVSGASSANLRHNLYCTTSPQIQPIPLALAISEHVLSGRGAVRVHGGGFAGTIQAFVAQELADEYKRSVEGVFGDGTCHRVHIRKKGACVLIS